MTPITSLDLDGRHYQQNSQFQYKLVKDWLNNYPFHLHKTVLDVGCGDGKITAEIAYKLSEGKVLGIDLSPSMLAVAREAFPMEHYSNIEFKLDNAEELNFNEQFDLIVSFSCIPLIRDKKKAFLCLKRALVPGGKMLLLVYPKDLPFYDLLGDTLHTDKWSSYYNSSIHPNMYYQKDYRDVVNELGLGIEEFLLKEEIACFENKQSIINLYRGWIGAFVSLPQEDVTSFLQDVSNLAAERWGQKDGKIHVPYRFLKMELIKH